LLLSILITDAIRTRDLLGNETEEDQIGRMQVSLGSKMQQLSHISMTQDCTASIPAADLDRPIPDVLAEHPGVGGSCYFGGQNEWFAECGSALKKHDFSKFGLATRNSANAATSYLHTISHDRNDAQLATIHYWRGTIKTNNLAYPWDDIYCHGSVDPLLQLLPSDASDYTFWSGVATAKCTELLKEFPANDRSFADMGSRSWLEGDTPNYFGNKAILNGSYVPTEENMRRHQAWKCAMDLDGVGCDMAYCASNFCALGGGYIGHTTECDQ